MTIDHVLDLLRKRADDLEAWGEESANACSPPEEVELLYAEARQWRDAYDVVRLCIREESS